MDNGESPFTLQMPTLARDNGCVVYVYVLMLMLMAPSDHCDEHIYVPVGGRWSAPVGRDRSCSVTTVHSIISSSRLILSLPCHVNIAQTQCHNNARMVILVTQRRLAGQCQTLNTAYS